MCEHPSTVILDSSLRESKVQEWAFTGRKGFISYVRFTKMQLSLRSRPFTSSRSKWHPIFVCFVSPHILYALLKSLKHASQLFPITANLNETVVQRVKMNNLHKKRLKMTLRQHKTWCMKMQVFRQIEYQLPSWCSLAGRKCSFLLEA